MAYISRQEIVNGQWWTWVAVNSDRCEIVTGKLTEADAQTIHDTWQTAHQYDSTPQIPVSIYDAKDAIEAAVTYIKTTGSLTLTKWNTYISGLALDNQYAVKWFIVTMAEKLAGIGEITLTDTTTELNILAQMRTWFINTPAARIRKIFYGA